MPIEKISDTRFRISTPQPDKVEEVDINSLKGEIEMMEYLLAEKKKILADAEKLGVIAK